MRRPVIFVNCGGWLLRQQLLLVTAILMLLQQHHCVNGFRTGAGSCDPGSEALLQSSTGLSIHGQLNQIGTGPLEEGSFLVELDGEILTPGNPTDFTYDVDHTMTLYTVDESISMTGFLVRMEAPDGTRTLEAIMPISEEGDVGASTTGGVQVAFICQTVNQVAGVTHVDNQPRKRVQMNLYMESPTDGLELDVTVVIKTDPTANTNEWYLSQYILNSVPPENAPTVAPTTDSPTSPPTPINETDMPTKPSDSAGRAMRLYLVSVIVATTSLLSGMFWSL